MVAILGMEYFDEKQLALVEYFQQHSIITNLQEHISLCYNLVAFLLWSHHPWSTTKIIKHAIRWIDSKVHTKVTKSHYVAKFWSYLHLFWENLETLRRHQVPNKTRKTGNVAIVLTNQFTCGVSVQSTAVHHGFGKCLPTISSIFTNSIYCEILQINLC